MDSDRRDRALGALALALVLIASSGLLAVAARSPDAPVDLDPAHPPAGVDPVTAAALGWPVDHDQPDPLAWQQLDGVGPTLSGRLAGAAAEGALECREDLLRGRGIGARMAADLAPAVRWPDGRER